MSREHDTIVSRFFAYIHNHRTFSAVVIICIVVTSLGTFSGAIEDILSAGYHIANLYNTRIEVKQSHLLTQIDEGIGLIQIPNSRVEGILENSTPRDGWISDIVILGLGTTNSVCNPRPVRTIVYRVSFRYRDVRNDTTTDVNDGFLRTDYCDGFFIARVPVSIVLPKYSVATHSFDLIDLRLRKTGFGFYFEGDEKYTEFIKILELLSPSDRMAAEERIREIIHDAQWSGLDSIYGQSLYEETEKKVFEVLNSYPKSRSGAKLSELRTERNIIVENIGIPSNTREARQRLRSALALIAERIATEEEALIPAQSIPFQALLNGGSSGTYDVMKEMVDPFPVWSSLGIIWVIGENRLEYRALRRTEFAPNASTLSKAERLLRESGLNIDLSTLVRRE